MVHSMHVRPILTIEGNDFSRYFISAHCEMTANSTKDPGKYDLVLSNAGQRFLGAFAPKSVEQITEEQMGAFLTAPKNKVRLDLEVYSSGCEGNRSRKVQIFQGEIQKAEADESYLYIEGSCSQGGMTSRLRRDMTWETGTPVSTIVSDLLKEFEYTGKAHIMPAKDSTDDITPYLSKAIDFDTAMYEVSCWGESIYFFDENDEFWFVPATDLRGFSNLTGNVLRGSYATNMVGYCNHVDVYGGSPELLWEGKTHQLIHAVAEAPEWELKAYGIMRAPPVVLPNANYERCKEVADKLLEWYRQYKDVPSVKVVGKAPGLLAKVAYRPWNGSPPPIVCDGEEEAEMGPVLGLVTRRIVDISAEGGFTATLDVTTNFLGVNKPSGTEDIVNFYSLNYERIMNDPGVVNKYPGVHFV